MRVTRLTLRNWRTFKNLEVEIGQRLFIVGPNASGKSHFLDALRFLRDLTLSTGGGLQSAISRRGGMPRVRSLFARNNNLGLVEISVSVGDDGDANRWQYTLALRSEPKGRRRPVVVREEVRCGERIVLSRPDAYDEADPERLTQTALEQISLNADFRELAEFFAHTRYLHLVPQLIRDPSRADDGAVDDPFGSDFIARINALPAASKKARLKRVTEALSLAVPQFESLEVEVDSAGRPHLVSRYRNWRQTAARQDEGDLSDGTLRLLGLLWTITDRSRDGAPVLLEEPELSLHPAVVRLLPAVLARAQRTSHAQVLITTHSPDLLADEGIGPGEVLILRVTSEGTVGQLLNEGSQAALFAADGVSVADIALAETRPPGIDELVRVSLAT